jgi:hypothetical protein
MQKKSHTRQAGLRALYRHCEAVAEQILEGRIAAKVEEAAFEAAGGPFRVAASTGTEPVK